MSASDQLKPSFCPHYVSGLFLIFGAPDNQDNVLIKTMPSRTPLSVLPVVQEVIDHRGISQRRDITELVVFVGGNLAQNPEYNLARPGLRQYRRPMY